MKKILFLLLILSLSCSSKKERVENKLMECINDIEDENGIKIKKSLELYESFLINENILKDKSASSYRNLLVNFLEEKNIEIKLNENNPIHLKVYKNRYDVSNENTFQKIFSCYNQLKKDSIKYDYVKFNLLRKATKGINGNDLSQIADKFSIILTEKDFELDFYKAALLNALIDYNAPPL